MKILLVLLATGFLALSTEVLQNGCPPQCSCQLQKTRDDPKMFKVRCVNNILSVNDIGLEHIAKQVGQLDLSKNNIEAISNGQFKNFTFLRRLDLSGNKLSNIPTGAFEGLESLERLKLNHNSISVLHRETVSSLSSLRAIEIGGNPFECQCSPTAPKDRCVPPAILRGSTLRAFKKDGIAHCEVRPAEILELRPNENQIVFEGDELRLRCRALGATPDVDSGLSSPYVSWFWGSKNPTLVFKEVNVENESIIDSGILGSLLTIKPVQRNHSGQWNCLFISGAANHSRTVMIIVISRETVYCPHTVTSNNKGSYSWPRTVAGFKVELPCKVESFGSAFYECDQSGSWKGLDTSACQYVRENSRTLYQLAQVDPRTVSSGAALDGARRLGKVAVLDSEDVSLLSRAVNNLVDWVVIDKDILSPVVDALRGLMSASPRALILAEQKDRACSRLVQILEAVAERVPVFQVHGTEMAVEKFRVKHESFLGITCTWFSVPSPNSHPTRLFHCSTMNASPQFSSNEKVVEASVQIPAVLFYQLEAHGMPVWLDHQLLVAMFHDSRLFPYIQPPGTKNRYVVTSIVAGAKLAGLPERELSEPLIVALRTNPDSRHAPIPVWWDSENGRWSERACNASHRTGNLLYIRCSRLGYFGLLQAQPETMMRGAVSHLPPTAVLASSAVLIFALIVAISSYVAPWPPLQVPRRTKHALVNTWAAMGLLVFLYSVGINQTEDVNLCQVIGLLLHYFSLSVILWMAVGLSTLHDQLQSTRLPTLSSEASDGSLETARPKSRPLLGLYLVGWGVSALVVGLSGALHLRQHHYTVPSAYCFLIPSASAFSVGIPAVAIIVHLLFNALLVRCRAGETAASATSAASRRQLSADVQLLGSEDGSDSPPTGQLSAALGSLVFFAFLWTGGALSAAAPLIPAVPDAMLIFSAVYATAATLLALFILVVHCIGRRDVRLHWRTLTCRSRGRGVCDVHPATSSPASLIAVSPPIPVRITPIPMSTPPPPPPPSSVNHVTTSRMSTPPPPSSVSHVTTSRVSTPPPPPPPPSSVIHVTTSRMSSPPPPSSLSLVTTTVEPDAVAAVQADPGVFYNPHQIDVARRFFRKQRRAAFQNGNGDLGGRRQGDGGSERSAPALTEGEDGPMEPGDGERCVIGAAASEGSIASSVGRRRRSRRRSRPRNHTNEHDQRNCGTLPPGFPSNEETCL